MKFLHDILRNRLEFKAGLNLQPKPNIDAIYKEQWNKEFETYMRNRMAQGYFRYGPLSQMINKNLYANIDSIKERLLLYEQTHNREHLVDIANLCLIEFTTHPNFPFRSTDDGVHVKRLK